jgi:hypothetical protein
MERGEITDTLPDADHNDNELQGEGFFSVDRYFNRVQNQLAQKLDGIPQGHIPDITASDILNNNWEKLVLD